MKGTILAAVLGAMSLSAFLPVSAVTGEQTVLPEESETVTRIVDQSGEVVQIVVTIDEDISPELIAELRDQVLENDINLLSEVDPVTGLVLLEVSDGDKGVYRFLDGICKVIEFLTGKSCMDIARYIGLTIVNGLYSMNGRPYTGTWQVQYGYIPGCEPRHSLTCFRVVYTKIG